MSDISLRTNIGFSPVETGNKTSAKQTAPAPATSQPSTPKAPERTQQTPPKDNVQMRQGSVASASSSPVNTSVAASFERGIENKKPRYQMPQEPKISPNGAKEFNKAETKKIISEAIEYGKKLHPNNPKAALDEAWGWSLQKRKGDPLDVNWAAAEHYLYARSTGKDSKVSAFTMGLLATGYDVAKAALFAVGKEEWLSTTGRKEDISRPTLGSAISGIQGAIDSVTED